MKLIESGTKVPEGEVVIKLLKVLYGRAETKRSFVLCGGSTSSRRSPVIVTRIIRVYEVRSVGYTI